LGGPTCSKLIRMKFSVSKSICIATVLFMVGCSNQNPGNNDFVPEEGVVYTVREIVGKGESRSVAHLAIEGMSCQMMCVGSVDKALKNLEGVTSVDFAFDAQVEVDTVVVVYDHFSVSDKALVDAVQDLYKGRYKVKAIYVDRYFDASTKKESAQSTEQPNSRFTPATRFSYSVPNIFGVFTAFFN
jgi:copper chaperone CopZ